MGAGGLCVGCFVRRGCWAEPNGKPSGAPAASCFSLALEKFAFIYLIWSLWQVFHLHNSVEQMGIHNCIKVWILIEDLWLSTVFIWAWYELSSCHLMCWRLDFLTVFAIIERWFRHEDWSLINVLICWWVHDLLAVLGVSGKRDPDKDVGPWDFSVGWNPALLSACNEASNCVSYGTLPCQGPTAI